MIWLCLFLLMWICSANNLNKCPSNLPYTGCYCIETSFQVRCNSSSNLTQIPDDLPDSVVMKIQGVNLEILNQLPYPNLMTLFLNDNNIRVIHHYAFSQLHNLCTLILNDNPIGELNHRVFTGLQHVELISLENTRLYRIPMYTFIGKDLPRLEMLKLSNASLYEIAPHSFHMLHNLALLNLSHNHLRLIPEFSSADSLTKLSHLDLSYNDITVITDMQNLHKLQMLFLHHNRIQYIGDSAFHGLDNCLVSIDLSHNGLNATAPTTFIRLQSLQSLYLNNNELRQMIWEELPWDNLVKLVLHDNPWRCECVNSWIIESELITIHNNNSRFQCDSPASVASRPILSVPLSTFDCPRRSQSVNTTTIIVFCLVIVLVAFAIVGAILCRFMKKKKSKENKLGSVISAYKRVQEDQGELILRT